jgi:putative flippase GtrA
MKTFARTQLAAFIASLLDYWVTISGVELFSMQPVWASCIGTISGGFLNFYLSRNWVFPKEGSARPQLIKYFMVWTGYLCAITWGVYMLHEFTIINYIWAKILVSLTLALGYNYPLQKHFVFRPSKNSRLLNRKDGI